jgi:hypothetical protein
MLSQNVPRLVVDLVGKRQIEEDVVNNNFETIISPVTAKSLLVSRIKECGRSESHKIDSQIEITRVANITFERSPGWKIDVFQFYTDEEKFIPVVTGPWGKTYPPPIVSGLPWDLFMDFRPHFPEMSELGQCHLLNSSKRKIQ